MRIRYSPKDYFASNSEGAAARCLFPSSFLKTLGACAPSPLAKARTEVTHDIPAFDHPICTTPATAELWDRSVEPILAELAACLVDSPFEEKLAEVENSSTGSGDGLKAEEFLPTFIKRPGYFLATEELLLDSIYSNLREVLYTTVRGLSIINLESLRHDNSENATSLVDRIDRGPLKAHLPIPPGEEFEEANARPMGRLQQLEEPIMMDQLKGSGFDWTSTLAVPPVSLTDPVSELASLPRTPSLMEDARCAAIGQRDSPYDILALEDLSKELQPRKRRSEPVRLEPSLLQPLTPGSLSGLERLLAIKAVPSVVIDTGQNGMELMVATIRESVGCTSILDKKDRFPGHGFYKLSEPAVSGLQPFALGAHTDAAFAKNELRISLNALELVLPPLWRSQPIGELRRDVMDLSTSRVQMTPIGRPVVFEELDLMDPMPEKALREDELQQILTELISQPHDEKGLLASKSPAKYLAEDEPQPVLTETIGPLAAHDQKKAVELDRPPPSESLGPIDDLIVEPKTQAINTNIDDSESPVLTRTVFSTKQQSCTKLNEEEDEDEDEGIPFRESIGIPLLSAAEILRIVPSRLLDLPIWDLVESLFSSKEGPFGPTPSCDSASKPSPALSSQLHLPQSAEPNANHASSPEGSAEYSCATTRTSDISVLPCPTNENTGSRNRPHHSFVQSECRDINRITPTTSTNHLAGAVQPHLSLTSPAISSPKHDAGLAHLESRPSTHQPTNRLLDTSRDLSCPTLERDDDKSYRHDNDDAKASPLLTRYEGRRECEPVVCHGDINRNSHRVQDDKEANRHEGLGSAHDGNKCDEEERRTERHRKENIDGGGIDRSMCLEDAHAPLPEPDEGTQHSGNDAELLESNLLKDDDANSRQSNDGDNDHNCRHEHGNIGIGQPGAIRNSNVPRVRICINPRLDAEKDPKCGDDGGLCLSSDDETILWHAHDGGDLSLCHEGDEAHGDGHTNSGGGSLSEQPICGDDNQDPTPTSAPHFDIGQARRRGEGKAQTNQEQDCTKPAANLEPSGPCACPQNMRVKLSGTPTWNLTQSPASEGRPCLACDSSPVPLTSPPTLPLATTKPVSAAARALLPSDIPVSNVGVAPSHGLFPSDPDSNIASSRQTSPPATAGRVATLTPTSTRPASALAPTPTPTQAGSASLRKRSAPPHWPEGSPEAGKRPNPRDAEHRSPVSPAPQEETVLDDLDSFMKLRGKELPESKSASRQPSRPDLPHVLNENTVLQKLTSVALKENAIVVIPTKIWTSFFACVLSWSAANHRGSFQAVVISEHLERCKSIFEDLQQLLLKVQAAFPMALVDKADQLPIKFTNGVLVIHSAAVPFSRLQRLLGATYSGLMFCTLGYDSSSVDSLLVPPSAARHFEYLRQFQREYKGCITAVSAAPSRTGQELKGLCDHLCIKRVLGATSQQVASGLPMTDLETIEVVAPENFESVLTGLADVASRLLTQLQCDVFGVTAKDVASHIEDLSGRLKDLSQNAEAAPDEEVELLRKELKVALPLHLALATREIFLSSGFTAASIFLELALHDPSLGHVWKGVATEMQALLQSNTSPASLVDEHPKMKIMMDIIAGALQSSEKLQVLLVLPSRTMFSTVSSLLREAKMPSQFFAPAILDRWEYCGPDCLDLEDRTSSQCTLHVVADPDLQPDETFPQYLKVIFYSPATKLPTTTAKFWSGRSTQKVVLALACHEDLLSNHHARSPEDDVLDSFWSAVEPLLCPDEGILPPIFDLSSVLEVGAMPENFNFFDQTSNLPVVQVVASEAVLQRRPLMQALKQWKILNVERTLEPCVDFVVDVTTALLLLPADSFSDASDFSTYASSLRDEVVRVSLKYRSFIIIVEAESLTERAQHFVVQLTRTFLHMDHCRVLVFISTSHDETCGIIRKGISQQPETDDQNLPEFATRHESFLSAFPAINCVAACNILSKYLLHEFLVMEPAQWMAQFGFSQEQADSTEFVLLTSRFSAAEELTSEASQSRQESQLRDCDVERSPPRQKQDSQGTTWRRDSSYEIRPDLDSEPDPKRRSLGLAKGYGVQTRLCWQASSDTKKGGGHPESQRSRHMGRASEKVATPGPLSESTSMTTAGSAPAGHAHPPSRYASGHEYHSGLSSQRTNLDRDECSWLSSQRTNPGRDECSGLFDQRTNRGQDDCSGLSNQRTNPGRDERSARFDQRTYLGREDDSGLFNQSDSDRRTNRSRESLYTNRGPNRIGGEMEAASTNQRRPCSSSISANQRKGQTSSSLRSTNQNKDSSSERESNYNVSANQRQGQTSSSLCSTNRNEDSGSERESSYDISANQRQGQTSLSLRSVNSGGDQPLTSRQPGLARQEPYQSIRPDDPSGLPANHRRGPEGKEKDCSGLPANHRGELEPENLSRNGHAMDLGRRFGERLIGGGVRGGARNSGSGNPGGVRNSNLDISGGVRNPKLEDSGAFRNSNFGNSRVARYLDSRNLSQESVPALAKPELGRSFRDFSKPRQLPNPPSSGPAGSRPSVIGGKVGPVLSEDDLPFADFQRANSAIGPSFSSQANVNRTVHPVVGQDDLRFARSQRGDSSLETSHLSNQRVGGSPPTRQDASIYEFGRRGMDRLQQDSGDDEYVAFGGSPHASRLEHLASILPGYRFKRAR